MRFGGLVSLLTQGITHMTAPRCTLAFVLSAVLLGAVCADPPKGPVPITPEVAAKLRDIAFQAARDDDLDTLKAYFASGLSMNDVNPRGDTLLTVAAYNGKEKAVELILSQPKVKVDARNAMGLTALAAAGFRGHTSIAERLVRAKADVNAANGSGQTALMFAALAGRVKTVEYLLSAGADARAADKSGNTARSLALGQGADAVVRLLEAKDAAKR